MIAADRAIVTLDESSHIYTHQDGHQPPSVTGILGSVPPWLHRFDRAKPEDVARKGDIGRAVHLACEYFDQRVLDWDSLDPEVQPYVEGWILFCQEKRVEVLAVEQRVYHPQLGYAGTLDRLLLADTAHGRGLVLGDIKTGDGSMAGPQTAAYLDAYAAMAAAGLVEQPPTLGQPVDRWSIQLLPTGRYALTDHTARADHRRDLRLFRAAFELYTFARSHA